MAEDEGDMVELDAEFLAQLEEEARNRYSQEDSVFMEHCKKDPPKPPILPAAMFDRNRSRAGGGGGGFRHREDRRGGRGDRYGQDSRDFRNHGGDRRREYSDHRQVDTGCGHRGYSSDRRDYGDRRDYRSDKRDYDYGRRDRESNRHSYSGSSY